MVVRCDATGCNREPSHVARMSCLLYCNFDFFGYSVLGVCVYEAGASVDAFDLAFAGYCGYGRVGGLVGDASVLFDFAGLDLFCAYLEGLAGFELFGLLGNGALDCYFLVIADFSALGSYVNGLGYGYCLITPDGNYNIFAVSPFGEVAEGE